MANAGMSKEEELEDLQRRFQLLEGERKATYESARLNIQQNKEIISQMKGENKSLRNEIASNRNQKPQSTEKVLESTMGSVQALQRKLDLLKHDTEKKKQHLKELTSKLDELSCDAKLPKTEDSPQMRHIRVLENRLDKAMIKHNEAVSIKKTYEGILKQLKQERMGFDSKLASIERTLKAKERDYEELLLLSHDAYHAKEMAQAELHRFEQGVMEERKQRDREVQEKKNLVQRRVEMNYRLEQREKMIRKQQELENIEKKQLEDSSSAMERTAAHTQADEELERLKDYEFAFNNIKEATGVNDVNEVIQKFLTQEDTRKNLQDLTDRNQKSIERLEGDRRKIRAKVDDLKFSSGGAGSRRQQIDDYEKMLAQATEKLERNQTKYERVAKILNDMISGVVHLSEKLGHVGDEAPIEMSDASLNDVMQQVSLKLGMLAEAHGGEESTEAEDEQYEEKLFNRSQSEVRVKLADQDDDFDDEDDLDDMDDEDFGNDGMSRKQVKYCSEQILEKQQTKNKRKAKKAAK